MSQDFVETTIDFQDAFAIQETASLREELERLRESTRYALATFRALDQYTFEDSDHGLLIAQAVKGLECDKHNWQVFTGGPIEGEAVVCVTCGLLGQRQGEAFESLAALDGE